MEELNKLQFPGKSKQVHIAVKSKLEESKISEIIKEQKSTIDNNNHEKYELNLNKNANNEYDSKHQSHQIYSKTVKQNIEYSTPVK